MPINDTVAADVQPYANHITELLDLYAAIPCARCGAEPWEPCQAAGGPYVTYWVHKARWQPINDAHERGRATTNRI